VNGVWAEDLSRTDSSAKNSLSARRSSEGADRLPGSGPLVSIKAYNEASDLSIIGNATLDQPSHYTAQTAYQDIAPKADE
jgi:hypothetical protein